MSNYAFFALLGAVGLFLLFRVFLVSRRFLRFGGKMLVTCPETKRPAAVEVNNWRAALAPIISTDPLRLSACSRWPDRRDCAQGCVCQIQEDPEAHRVWAIAAQWYEGKACAYCGRPVELHHFEHAPALMDTVSKVIKEWNGLPAETLQESLAASLPVCWNCYVTEAFIQEHPERTVIRPWKHSPPWAKN